MAATASRSSSERRERREGREGREGLAPSNVSGRGAPAASSPAGVSLDRISERDGRKASPLGEVLERLTRVDAGEHRVVTCYLKLEPRDRTRGKYLIKLKNRVKAGVQGLPRLNLERSVVDQIQRDLNRIQQFLKPPSNLPSTQGVAVFACEGIELFETVPLPVVHRSRLAVDRTPLVRELASVEEEFGRLLTVVLDRASARFFQVTAYETQELPGLRADSTRGKRFHGDQNGSGGWGEHTYHNRIRQEKQRHYEAIARELFNIDRRQTASGIVLAGPGPEAGAVEPFLHTYLKQRLIGTARLNPKDVTAATVHATTLATRERYERASERVLVHEMLEGVGTGWAVNGLTPTLRALSRGQVRSLLVHAEASVPGFRCGDSGRLALTERECRGEGEPIAVLDVVDDAIEEALRQGVDVNVVYEPEARDAIESLAALLRFR
jgi:peptide subunit release factor 1 (eRF1)